MSLMRTTRIEAILKTRSHAMSSVARPSLAVLDDYLEILKTHFAQIPPEKLSVSVLRDSSLPYTRPQTSQAQMDALVDRLKPFTAISSMHERTPFPREILQRLPNLRLLLATGTQFQTFDLTATKELGITAATAPGKGRTDGKRRGSHPTTQHTWALILALAGNIVIDDAVMKNATVNGWQTQLAKGLTGATLGVVGLGRLGAAIARIGALAWGMNVICWSENLTQQKANQKAEEIGLPRIGGGPDPEAPTFRVVSKEELFRSADVVSLHYVLNDRSRRIVGANELGLMKDAALLVNTSRGPLVDDTALYEVLQKGGIRGAALDDLDIGPLPATSPWRSQEWGRNGRGNLLITPHMGYTEGLIHTWYEETAENVERWLDGREILNPIN